MGHRRGRASLVALAGLAVCASVAQADIPAPPAPLWGTPAPRSTQRPAVVAVLPMFGPRSEVVVSVGLDQRDPVVAMRSEDVELVVRRSVTEVHVTLVLEGGETDANGWRMGIIAEANAPFWRTHGTDLYFLRVSVDGRDVDIAMRAYSREAEMGPPLVEAWYEWTADVPAHGTTQVEVSYLVGNSWYAASGDDWEAHLPEEHRPTIGYVLWLRYQLAEGQLYRGGRGRTHVSARMAPGVTGTWRVALGAAAPQLHDGPTLALDVDPAELGPLAIDVRFDGDPFHPPPVDPDAPRWMTWMERAVFPFPFDPSEAMPFVPAFDAASFTAIVDELHAAEGSSDAREREVAGELLAGIATGARQDWELQRYEEEEAARAPADPHAPPSARPPGPYWLPMSGEEWWRAQASAAAWVCPSVGEEDGSDVEPEPDAGPSTLGDDDWVEAPPADSDVAIAARAAAEMAELLTPLPRGHGAPLRELARAARPPHGIPDQLVTAYLAPQRSREAMVLGAIALAVCGGTFVFVRRQRARRR